MDNLSYLLEHGMPSEEITGLMDKGISLDEIAESVRWRVQNGEPIIDPQEAVKAVLPDLFDEKHRFLHNIMGDYLIENYNVCKINNTIHIYDDNLYKPGEDALHKIMIDLLPSLTYNKRLEVYRYIKVCRKTPVREISPPHLIPFRHRIYNLNTGEFLEYSKDFVFLNRFPWDYEPDAPAVSVVDDTIRAIANQDEEVVKLLLEAFGNCFYRKNIYAGVVFLFGNGSNGKSTLLNMLCRLTGRENTSFLSLQDTAQKFRLMEIYGKTVNIGDDIPDEYFPDTSIFKRLVTGEQVIAEKKGKDPVTLEPYAKLFFAMNDLPPIKDKSDGFFRRILLIPLLANFSGINKNVNLKDRQWTEAEMKYLVRLSMDGLKRLMQQGKFTEPQCVKDALWEYRLESDPVLAFLTEQMKDSDIVGAPIEKLYNEFCYWCTNAGHKNVITRARFTREVCKDAGVKSGTGRDPYFESGIGRCFVAKKDKAF